LARTLASSCLGRKPKARVATTNHQSFKSWMASHVLSKFYLQEFIGKLITKHSFPQIFKIRKKIML
jgi:hypothetical protein